MPVEVQPAGAGHEIAWGFPTTLEWNCNVRRRMISADWAWSHGNGKTVLLQTYIGETNEAGEISTGGVQTGKGRTRASMLHNDDPRRMTPSVGAGPRKREKNTPGGRG